MFYNSKKVPNASETGAVFVSIYALGQQQPTRVGDYVMQNAGGIGGSFFL